MKTLSKNGIITILGIIVIILLLIIVNTVNNKLRDDYYLYEKPLIVLDKEEVVINPKFRHTYKFRTVLYNNDTITVVISDDLYHKIKINDTITSNYILNR